MQQMKLALGFFFQYEREICEVDLHALNMHIYTAFLTEHRPKRETRRGNKRSSLLIQRFGGRGGVGWGGVIVLSLMETFPTAFFQGQMFAHIKLIKL